VYKLGALDAGFLYSETDRCPQHIASVQVLQLPEGVSAEAFVAQMRELLLARIHLVPYFTRKLQFVPFNLDHPVLVRDHGFDIDNHYKTVALAAPGGRAELETKIAELHAQRLDRRRPLWDFWVITGLKGGLVAYYNRVHHACLDGVSGQAMIETIMDLETTPRAVEPPADDFHARDEQSPAALVSGAVENFLKYQINQASGALGMLDAATRVWQRAMDPNRGLGALTRPAPATRFNKAVHRERRWATGELPLATAKAIAKRCNASLNDVFLAACSGALRRYLDECGELPEDSLVAGCPVSLRQPGDNSTNNQVTMMLVSFATDEADPVRRLKLISRSARTAKGLTADVARGFDSNVALPGLPAVMQGAIRATEGLGIADMPGLRPPMNVVVSNVPGPQCQLYSNGARVLAHYPVSLAAHTQGVNITVQSYNSMLFFAVTSCARTLSDADRLSAFMLDAFEELRAAVLDDDAAVGVTPEREVTVAATAAEDAMPDIAETLGERSRAA